MAGGTTLSTSMQEIARHDPRAVAVIDRGREVTYGELHAAAGRMAAWLARRGLGPGDMVGVTIRQELPHLVVSLGLMRLGCDQIGLASQDPVAMRADLAARVRAAAVIGDGPADALEGVSLVIPDHQAIAEDRQLDHDVLHSSGPEGTRVVFTSSGTTGRPKLIPISERLLRTRALIRIDATERRHLPVALEFGQARRTLFVTLAAGGSWVFANNGDDLPLLDLVRRYRVDQVTLAPRRAETLLNEAARAERPDRWPSGTRLNVTGASVPGVLRHRIERELTRDLWVHFGSTEYGLASIAMPGDHERYPDGVGRPWGTEVIIVDAEGRRLPRGETGTIRVLSAGRAEGYLDDPLETRRVFLPGGWFHSGDVGSITPDGHILFGGRGDDMMILGTINIFPAEIEGIASIFPGVAECAAFGYRTNAHGDVPMLAVVETEAGAVDVAGLLAHCRGRLGLRAPRKVLIMESLPRNSGGKIVRRLLASTAMAS